VTAALACQFRAAAVNAHRMVQPEYQLDGSGICPCKWLHIQYLQLRTCTVRVTFWETPGRDLDNFRQAPLALFVVL
jgi:hypothetical protein